MLIKKKKIKKETYELSCVKKEHHSETPGKSSIHEKTVCL